MRQHPDPHANILVSAAVRSQLLSGVMDSKFEKEDWEIAEEAINEWTRRHNPEALEASRYCGYQWKQLFLPSGTVLRTVFGGRQFHCTVDGDRILYKDNAVSPSVFVNAVGGIRRNAWRCVWILFPDATHWALADSLRPRTRPSAARKPAARPGPDAEPAPAQVQVQSQPPASPCAAITPASPAIPEAADASCAGGEQRPGRHVQARIPERRSGGDAAMTTLFRHELLPLLTRILAANGMAAMVPEPPG